MLGSNTQQIIILVIACTILILLLISFITIIVYRYQQKQHSYFKDLEKLNTRHENALLYSRLEMQEQTFQNISREIHDNIGQKLTLVKLYLNTLNLTEADTMEQRLQDSVKMIGEAIADLSDISRSMSSEMVLTNGLIRAMEYEVNQLEKLGLYKISFSVNGDTVFMDAYKELLIFRIVQEALNNILKHAYATTISIQLHYNNAEFILSIEDNGKGFDDNPKNITGIGLVNMGKRANLLGGKYNIDTQLGIGTKIKINIPLNQNNGNNEDL